MGYTAIYILPSMGVCITCYGAVHYLVWYTKVLVWSILLYIYCLAWVYVLPAMGQCIT